jgi:hypothetical protein
MELKDFYNKHKDQTCLLVGIGPNLTLTPPEWFNYPSFSVNTIFRYKGWKPTYYVGVDARLFRENGKEILDNFGDIPKFIPSPDQDAFEGENIYRFRHRQGGDLFIGGKLPNQKDSLTGFGITYYRVMDAVMQIAWHMGFTTMLIIGMQHKTPTPEEPQSDVNHFWGIDTIAVQHSMTHWFNGYQTVIRSMGEGVKVLNISADTYVPNDVITRDDWRNWKNT